MMIGSLNSEGLFSMPMKFLGKVLFPHLAPWQRKKQTKIIVLVFLAAVIFAAAVGAIMLAQNAHR